MAQTPQQRRANEAFAKKAEVNRGKSEEKRLQKKSEKSPISRPWIIVLGFVVCGGIIFELGSVIFKALGW